MITTERRIPLDPAITDDSETVSDAWYVDIDTALPCERPRSGRVVGYLTTVYTTDGRPNVPVVSFTDIGKRETGYVLANTKTITSHYRLPDGTTKEVVSTAHQDVTEITERPLDPALFEPPAGFVNVSPGSWGYYWKVSRQWLEHAVRRVIG